MNGNAPDAPADDPADARVAGSLVALVERADLAARPTADGDLAARAVTLGRRRLRVRTAARTGGVLVAASVLVAGAVTAYPDQVRRVPVVGTFVPAPSTKQSTKRSTTPAPDPYAHFMDERTRGSFADDTTVAGEAAFAALRTEAFAVWATAKDVSPDRDRGVFDDLRGEPHLVWAGQTATGPAAVVAQDAYLHPHEGLRPEDVGPQTLIGYLTTGPDGALNLTADDDGTDDRQTIAGQVRAVGLVGTWLDLDRRILLVVDPGYPLVYSTAWDYHPDGSAARVWQPVDVQDGAVSIDLPDHVDPAVLQVARTPVRDWADVQRVGPGRASDAAVPNWAAAATVLPWADTHRCVAIGRADLDAAGCDAWAEALVGVRMDRTGIGAVTHSSLPGRLVGRTPDGRTFVVATLAEDADPSRVVGGVLTGTDPDHVTAATLVDSGVLDPDAALPVAVRLPDAQGWVVAAVGAALRHRPTASDPWTDAGTDAALLPDAATLQVEVTRGGRPTVVTLGG